jgi:hypothetical protein
MVEYMLDDVAFRMLNIVLGKPADVGILKDGASKVYYVIWICRCRAEGCSFDHLCVEPCDDHANVIPLFRGASVDRLSGRLAP